VRLGEARIAARRAFDAGPDPYAHLDRSMATKLGGAIWMIAVLYALVVLPIAPPEGLGAWLASVAIMVGAAGIGLWLLKSPEPQHPNVLYAICFAGVGGAVAFRLAAGEGAPFPQFLFLASLYAGAVHPFRRSVLVFSLATVAAFTLPLYAEVGGSYYAQMVAQAALWWSLGVVITVWTTKMRRERAEAASAQQAADQLARIDALTGLGNRRALEEALATAAASARRHQRPLCALVSDLDDFKRVNDTFGHQAGDELLREVAKAFEDSVRVPDPCFRWGGDEFVALLPEAGLEEARAIAERVMATVARTARDPKGRAASISVGVAELGPEETTEALLARADDDLLAVKERRKARWGGSSPRPIEFRAISR
jgi:diguanylate cyclase (GGDEF)-like protein